MSEVVIKVQNLSKQYRIGARKGYKTFRETLVDSARAPFLRLGGTWRRALRARSKTLSPKLSAPHPTLSSSDSIIWALKDVSFEVRRGEVVGIIGRNGAGKSTLLKIMSQITEPTEGRVELKGRVGSLLEVGIGFHPELTGHENIYLYGAILGMDRYEITRKFDEIVDFAEIEKFIHTPVKKYSSGMFMRLAFAVAAHLEPQILLVDEVLAVGDAAFQKKCLGKMNAVAREGRTVLFVSHNMGAVQSLCNRSILLDGGRKVGDGKTLEVVADYFRVEAQSSEAFFGPDTPRRGTHDLFFTKCKLLNKKGHVTSSIPMGESMIVELYFDSNLEKPVAPIFGVVIRTGFDQPILRFITHETHGEMPLSLKGGVVRLKIERLDLLPGTYFLNLGINSKYEELDIIENAMKVEITPTPIYPTGKFPPKEKGVFSFAPCSWTYDYS